MADFVIAAELSLRDRLTTPLRGVVRSMQDLTRGADRASEAIDEIGASSSAIDSIDTSGARAEMKQLEASADQASDAIRTIADPKINGSQAKKELQGIEKEAKSLRSTFRKLTKTGYRWRGRDSRTRPDFIYSNGSGVSSVPRSD